jgi:hypothetical protein
VHIRNESHLNSHVENNAHAHIELIMQEMEVRIPALFSVTPSDKQVIMQKMKASFDSHGPSHHTQNIYIAFNSLVQASRHFVLSILRFSFSKNRFKQCTECSAAEAVSSTAVSLLYHDIIRFSVNN